MPSKLNCWKMPKMPKNPLKSKFLWHFSILISILRQKTWESFCKNLQILLLLFLLKITIEIWKHFPMFLSFIFMFQFLVGRCRLWLFWLCYNEIFKDTYGDIFFLRRKIEIIFFVFFSSNSFKFTFFIIIEFSPQE